MELCLSGAFVLMSLVFSFRSRISSTAGWRGAGVPGRITSPLGVQADVANSLARIDSMSRAVASSSRRRLAARQATLKPNEDISTEIADILDMTLKGDLQEQSKWST